MKNITKNIEMRILLICSLLSMFSCGYLSSNTNNELSQEEDINSVAITKLDTAKIRLSKGIEKVIIEYWDNYYANNFIFTILSSDAETKITYRGEILFTEKKILEDPVACNLLISYINQFYINKTDSIILNKTKRDYIVSTDYPNVQIFAYQNGKEVIKVKTKVGEERYDVEYHPKFIEFYELLDSLVKER